jgi:hypothetical protein
LVPKLQQAGEKNQASTGVVPAEQFQFTDRTFQSNFGFQELTKRLKQAHIDQDQRAARFSNEKCSGHIY